MKRYEYADYQEYLRYQLEAFERKRETHQTATRENIKILADYIREIWDGPLGICHGTRSGLEQQWFREFMPFARVIGTEIGPTEDPDTIQWDFNVTNKSWLFSADFVYSNAFDHAWSLQTFNVWRSQLAPGGLLMIEQNGRDEHVNRTESLAMTMRDWIRLSSGGCPLYDILFLDATDRQRYKIVLVYRRVS